MLGPIAYHETIHSLFFHGSESPLVCNSINLFTANDNGIIKSFKCCSIKVSADNDKSRFNASSPDGLDDVCTMPTLAGDSSNGVSYEKTNVRQFSRGFQEKLNALGPDFQSCVNDDPGEVSIGPCEVRRKGHTGPDRQLDRPLECR